MKILYIFLSLKRHLFKGFVILGVFILAGYLSGKMVWATPYGQGSYSSGVYSGNSTPTPTPTQGNSDNSNPGGSSGGGSGGVPVCDSQAPSFSPNLFQINANNNQAVLYFSPISANVTNYYVTYGYTAGEERFGVFTNQGAANGVLSYAIGHLNRNTSYFFRIRAFNNCAGGRWSNEMKATTTNSRYNSKVFYKDFTSKLKSIISNGISTLSSSMSVNKTAANTNLNCEYVVVSGDSVWKIAKERNDSYVRLMEANGITSNRLYIGQKLKVGC